jgi:hypothetical protein
MLTKEQFDLLKAKKAEELTDEEKASITEYEKQLASSASKDEHTVPISRLNEEIAKRKELEARVAAIDKANKEAEEKRLVEANNFKALYEQAKADAESLRPKASVAEESEKVLKSVLESQINELPESMRGLVPEGLTTNQQLSWLSKNKSLLMKDKPFDIAAGKQGGGSPETVTLTPEQLEMANLFKLKPEEYAKNMDKKQ